jgi:signal transduction histidine kinase
MFSRLRLRLTLLFLLAGMVLTALIAGGVYGLLRYSFETATDQALQRKVELGAIGLQVQPTLPPALEPAPQPTRKPTREPTREPTLQPTRPSSGESEDSEDAGVTVRTSGGGGSDAAATGQSEDSEGGGLASPATGGGGSGAAATGEHEDDRYDAELAPIFLVPLDAQGRIVGSTVGTAPPLAPDAAGVSAAESTGSDWRTLVQPDGTTYRLLTKRVLTSAGPVYLQAGRSLADQQRILQQLVLWILGLSAVTTLFLGWGSWWLAGRSLGPAQQAWERQQAFVANASHELRTPLTLLRASAEVAQRRLPQASPSAPLLQDVLRETDHMAALVEDLLLLSRLDAGALPMDIAPLEVAGLFNGLESSAIQLAQERGVSLTFEAGQARVLADPVRLRQVLLVLIDNALRHTSSGGQVRVEAKPGLKTVRLVVRDNGSGIAPEHMPHVFERFYRADPERSSGSGLGLPIARSMVLGMHGEIHLASTPGQGTAATVTLPAAAKAPLPPAQA